MEPLNGHEAGNGGHSQGASCTPPRRSPTRLDACLTWVRSPAITPLVSPIHPGSTSRRRPDERLAKDNGGDSRTVVAASGNLRTMHAHRMTMTVPEDHQVVVRLSDYFPASEAEVTVLPRYMLLSLDEAAAEYDRLLRLLASLPTAPVIARDALDRAKLNR
jgi:hypothetical protein